MQVKKVEIYPLALMMKSPFKTAHGTTLKRPLTLVAITLMNGITGYGEIQSFADNQYAPETHLQSLSVVKRLSEKLLSRYFDTPFAVATWLANQADQSFAKAAIEMAFWDAYGKQIQQPLWTMLGGQQHRIAVSSVVGMQTNWQQTSHLVSNMNQQGYQRIKIKIDQQTDIPAIRQLVAEFPDQMFSLDANASWSMTDIERLKALDRAGLALIEQPFQANDWTEHKFAQQQLTQLQLSLDESLNSLADAKYAIANQTTRALTIKQGKLGGIASARQAIMSATQAQLNPWIGGMLGSGLGRAVDLALASLPGANQVPADSAQFDHYFAADIGKNLPYVQQGTLPLPAENGIGVSIDWPTVTKYLVHEPIVYQ
nr:o-succinylbenzoate synthase [Weissella fangxianensis]